MDWQSMVAFSIVFHLVGFGIRAAADWQARLKTDQLLREIRAISNDIDSARIKRVK
jgi:hypothetical protein